MPEKSHYATKVLSVRFNKLILKELDKLIARMNKNGISITRNCAINMAIKDFLLKSRK